MSYNIQVVDLTTAHTKERIDLSNVRAIRVIQADDSADIRIGSSTADLIPDVPIGFEYCDPQGIPALYVTNDASSTTDATLKIAVFADVDFQYPSPRVPSVSVETSSCYVSLASGSVAYGTSVNEHVTPDTDTYEAIRVRIWGDDSDGDSRVLCRVMKGTARHLLWARYGTTIGLDSLDIPIPRVPTAGSNKYIHVEIESNGGTGSGTYLYYEILGLKKGIRAPMLPRTTAILADNETGAAGVQDRQISNTLNDNDSIVMRVPEMASGRNAHIVVFGYSGDGTTIEVTLKASGQYGSGTNWDSNSPIYSAYQNPADANTNIFSFNLPTQLQGAVIVQLTVNRKSAGSGTFYYRAWGYCEF